MDNEMAGKPLENYERILCDVDEASHCVPAGVATGGVTAAAGGVRAERGGTGRTSGLSNNCVPLGQSDGYGFLRFDVRRKEDGRATNDDSV